MTLNGAIMQLVELSEHPIMPVIFRPAIQKVIETISELEENPEPHWIPVERALPELRHDVLLTVFFHEKWNVTEGYRQDGEFMFWNHGRLDSVLDEENRVIAWMPKPEPMRLENK